MKMKPLLLSSSRGSWQIPAHHGTEQDGSPKMKEVRQKILDRDKNVCQFCGFKSSKWQEIHHINDDHNNYAESNLCCACPFCHQCFHLGIAGTTDGGKLIWLPEISQAELNHLVRGLFIAMRQEKSALEKAANSLYTALDTRRVFMDQHFSPGSDNPLVLGQAFLKMKKEDYEKRSEYAKSIKLLPHRSRFEAQIKYWAENVYRDLSPESWENLVDMAKIESAKIGEE